MPRWLRWVLIVPAAGIAYFLVQIIGGLASETIPLSDRGQDLFSQALNSALGPWALVRVGAAIAPFPHSFSTAAVLSALVALVTAALLGAAFIGNATTGYAPGWLLFTSMISFVALFVASWQVRAQQARLTKV